MSAKEQCEELIRERMERGESRERAAARVFKEHPNLREEMVAEANEARDPRHR